MNTFYPTPSALLSSYDGMMSGDPEKRRRALLEVSVYRLRAQLPVAVEVTAAISEAWLVGFTLGLCDLDGNQPCPSGRAGESVPGCDVAKGAGGVSSALLASSLSAAVIRFVNGLVDRQNGAHGTLAVSTLARELRIPQHIVDCRHRATHQGAPDLIELLSCSKDIIAWLDERFWAKARYGLSAACQEACLASLRMLLSNRSGSGYADCILSLYGSAEHLHLPLAIPSLLCSEGLCPADLEGPTLGEFRRFLWASLFGRIDAGTVPSSLSQPLLGPVYGVLFSTAVRYCFFFAGLAKPPLLGGTPTSHEVRCRCSHSWLRELNIRLSRDVPYLREVARYSVLLALSQAAPKGRDQSEATASMSEASMSPSGIAKLVLSDPVASKHLSERVLTFGSEAGTDQALSLDRLPEESLVMWSLRLLVDTLLQMHLEAKVEIKSLAAALGFPDKVVQASGSFPVISSVDASAKHPPSSLPPCESGEAYPFHALGGARRYDTVWSLDNTLFHRVYGLLEPD